MSGNKHWRKASDEKLKMLWPSYPKDALLKAFPGRNWNGLQCRAAALGIRRKRKFTKASNPTKDHLMERLREEREARNLTAKQLAEMIGHSDHYICGCERGTHLPSYPVIHKWAAALGAEITVRRLAAQGEGK